MLHDYTFVTPASVETAAAEGIAAADALVQTLVDHAGPRTRQDSLEPLDAMADVLAHAYGQSAFMGRVHPDEAVRAAGVAAEERLSKWSVDLIARDDLYSAVSAYATTEDAAALEGAEERLLAFWMRDFRRAGHELDPDDRAEVQRLRTRLVELQVAFQRNLDEYEDFLELTRDQLDGLPNAYVAGLKDGEEPGTHRVSLDYPDYVPFMQNATRRELRRRLEMKNLLKGGSDNLELIAEAVRLRQELAAKLGYPTWAHYAMEEKMAKDPEAVAQFYEDLVPGLGEKAAEQYVVMAALLGEDHPDEELRSWDIGYLDTQQRKQDYGVDPHEVAEYFSLDDVMTGMFDLTGEVFGLEYRRIADATAWHPDVHLYEIVDTDRGEPIAWFYADLFPREGKYGHAAAFTLVPGRATADGYQKPIAAIVANFTKPTAGQPSLLKHDEVNTLFHEFGHILHMCITEVEIARFSGAETEWDFVEAPSQIMEHWTWQAEVLQRFARHHGTGDPIPEDLVERLVAARNLNEAVFTLRQVYYGKLDLGIHTQPEVSDLEAIDREAFAVTALPFHEGGHMLSGFGHLMGGYDAGYYGYLWSKVYGDDMFSIFERDGITSREVGRRYRRDILSRGGTVDADVMLRDFLGREPSSEAFLRHLGLDKSSDR